MKTAIPEGTSRYAKGDLRVRIRGLLGMRKGTSGYILRLLLRKQDDQDVQDI